jgi:hypothetical protein
MAPVSGSNSFTVEHPSNERYDVVAPWGRIVATFATADDGPEAEALAGALAQIESAMLGVAAGHMEVPVTEIVMAFQAAYEDASWAVGPEALAPGACRRRPPATLRAHLAGVVQRRRCRNRVSYTPGAINCGAINRVGRRRAAGGTR